MNEVKITRRGLLRWLGVAGAAAALPPLGGILPPAIAKETLEGVCKVETKMVGFFKTRAAQEKYMRAELAAFERAMQLAWDEEHPNRRPVKQYSAWRIVPAHLIRTPDGDLEERESYEVYIRYSRRS